MNKVTGHKRTHDRLGSDEEQVQPSAAQHPTPPLNTSRCTVKAIPGHQPRLQVPPRFPGEPLNPCFGVWGWLPASMVEEFRGKHYAPFMQAPPEAPGPLPASHTPPDLIVQSAVDTGKETDAQLLEQLKQACDAHVELTGRTNAAVTILREPKPLNERVTLLMNASEAGGKLAQHLLSLLECCEPHARARGYFMSLFLAMRRVPSAHRHRMSFIKNLPPTLSPELQSHATAIQDYWVNLANSQRGKEETRELASAVCKHFGW